MDKDTAYVWEVVEGLLDYLELVIPQFNKVALLKVIKRKRSENRRKK